MVDGNRYILMAHGMLLFLVLPPSWMDVSVMSKTRQSITGKLTQHGLHYQMQMGMSELKLFFTLADYWTFG